MTDKMEIARGRLALHAGFWLQLACKMEWIPEPPPGGGGFLAATNGRKVWYDRDRLNEMPLGQVVYIALHEIGHPMLCHCIPNGNRDPMIAGIAKDIVLNEILDKMAKEEPRLKLEPPPNRCTSEAFGGGYEGLTWEAVYDKLVKDHSGKGGGKGQGKGQGQGFDEHIDPTNADGTQMTPAQAEQLSKEWRIATVQAAQTAKRMGKLPSFIEELIGDMTQPKVDWRTQLRNCALRIAKDETSYRRFNRRHIHNEIYLPGMYSERIRKLAYGCDTSGSMHSGNFVAAKAEMSEIIEDMKPDALVFLQCDAKLHSVVEMTHDDLPLPPLKIYGRGGTDMKEMFEWVKQNEHDLDAFIIQTDAEIPPLDPALIPNIPVIWLLTTSSALPRGCDFGTQIRVEV